MRTARRWLTFCLTLMAWAPLWAHPLDGDGDGYPDVRYDAPWTPQQEAAARKLAGKIANARFGWSVSSYLRDLRGLGPAARFAVPEVIMVMERFDGRPKEAALALLKEPAFLREAVYPALVTNQEHPNKWVRKLAINVTSKPAAVDLPVYQHCLTDPDPAVRKKALWSISVLGEDARPAAAAVAERVWHDREAMFLGLFALGRMGARAQLEDLLARAEQVSAEDPAYKHAANLKSSATVNLAMVYETTLAAADASAFSRAEAARKLRTLSWLGKEAASALVSALGASEREVRDEAAATLLAQFERSPAVVTRALVNALDATGERPGPAAFLLSRLGEQAVPHLLPLLDDVQADARVRGVVAFATLGEAAASASPRLATLAERDVDAKVRQAAQRALVGIGQGQTEAIALAPPATTVSNYVVAAEAQARWLQVQMDGPWSAGFVFATLPPAAPAPLLRIALYDADKQKLDTILIADHFLRKPPGEYFLKLFAQSQPPEAVSIPFKVEFVEE